MPSFSDLVWAIPLLYFLIFIMSLVIGKGRQKSLAIFAYVISTVAFLWSCGMLWERIFFPTDDYSFDIDWLVLGDVVYQVGYELNNSAAWLIMLISSMNLLMLLLESARSQMHYGYIGLMFGSMSGVVLADHMFTFFIFAILTSCGAYLLLANPAQGLHTKVIFRLASAQMLGFAVFFIAIVGLYWYMPLHSLQFTMLETVFSSSFNDFTPFMKTIIAASIVGSSFLIAGVAPYANWMKHMESDRNLLSIITFCTINILLPMYILLRFQMIIGSTEPIIWFCKIAGLIMIVVYTIRMLLNVQQSRVYIGLLLLGSIVFAYGHGVLGYVLMQLTIIILSLIVIYGASMQASSIIAYGSYLVATLTLIGVPPLGGYWMQQSLIVTIAEQGLGWYVASLLIVLCCAMGMTIYVASQWKNEKNHAGKNKFSIVLFPAIALVGLGLLWLVKHSTIEEWLFNMKITESMRLVPMLLTMLSVVLGVAIAWLFSERITEAFAHSLERADVQLKRKSERMSITLSKFWDNVVKTEQLVERGIEQLLTLWLPYPIRFVSRLGEKANTWYSLLLVIMLTIVITAVWYVLRGR